MAGEPTPFGLVRNEQDSDPTGAGIVREVSTGWLAEYIEYASGLTDSPGIFHLAVGLSMLSTACGARITFHGAGKEMWPNLYVLFVAPSGLMRKSTSIEIGLNLLRATDPEMLFPNETSREEFLHILATKPEGLIRESEFASALARYASSYMTGMKELVTELYDNVPEYRRQLRGKDGAGEKLIIRRPALNYLAASTLEWLVDSLTINDMRSGFMSRFLIFPAAGRGEWVPFLTEPDEPAQAGLCHLLSDVRRLRGSSVSFRAVRKLFAEWSKRNDSLADTGTAEIVGFYSRMTVHCAKLCTLLELSQQGARDRYEISEETFARACRLMEWLRDRYEELLERRLIFSKEERVMQGVLEQVRKTGKVEWRVALRKSHLKTQDFQRYVGTLLDRGDLNVITEQTRTKPAKMLCLPQANGKWIGNVADLRTLATAKAAPEP